MVPGIKRVPKQRTRRSAGPGRDCLPLKVPFSISEQFRSWGERHLAPFITAPWAGCAGVCLTQACVFQEFRGSLRMCGRLQRRLWEPFCATEQGPSWDRANPREGVPCTRMNTANCWRLGRALAAFCFPVRPHELVPL